MVTQKMMDCMNSARNQKRCTCTSEGCERHGICCDCIAHHRSSGELPGCLFTREQERTYDRSIAYYVRSRQNPPGTAAPNPPGTAAPNPPGTAAR